MMDAPGKLLTPIGEVLLAVQLLEIWLAPRLCAAAMPASRSLLDELLVSTSRMRQLGHRAETASRSSDSSDSQEAPALCGSGDVAPLWLTLVKQPLAAVHGGRP